MRQVHYISSALLLSFFWQSDFAWSTDCKNSANSLVSLAPAPDKQQIISAQSPSELRDLGIVPPNVFEIAETIGIFPLMEELKKAQEKAKTLNENNAIERINAKQKILYLHNQITEYMQTANLELNSVIGKLNSGMAQLADSKALISDQRAKMVRRNSTINMFSGGMTKIGGYTSALTPASPIPTNVLEVFDGGVQMILSASNILQQRGESKFYSNKPVILKVFISGKNDTSNNYPESVWAYVNRIPNGQNGKSRRDILIDSWVRGGRLVGNSGRRNRQNNNNASPTASPREKIIMDDIDDAVAMMSDIKSTISGMESSLMELSHAVKSSYSSDPGF